MQIQFENQVVVVSGAGHGLGRAIAEAFTALGARVWGCSPYAAEVPGVRMTTLDLADRVAAASWIAAVEAEAGGAVDVLVNNAGGVAGHVHQPVDEVPDSQWDTIMAANVGAAFTLARAAAGGMKRRGSGRIVNISSGAGLQPSLTGIQAYTSAKHAVVGLTRQLAQELGQHGITVNSVAPGLILSNPDTDKQWASYGAAGQAAVVGRIALRRMGTPADIANAVLFFASPLADFVNGQILRVDGGR